MNEEVPNWLTIGVVPVKRGSGTMSDPIQDIWLIERNRENELRKRKVSLSEIPEAGKEGST